MICKKCQKDMRVMHEVKYGNGIRRTYGCCGVTHTQNENSQEISEKYSLPTPDEVNQKKSEALKKLNSGYQQPVAVDDVIALTNTEQTEKMVCKCYGVDCAQCIFNYRCSNATI